MSAPTSRRRPRDPRGAIAEAAGEAAGWTRAIGLGLRDTARDMLEAGRRGARDAYAEGWDRFDQKTKKGRYRRR